MTQAPQDPFDAIPEDVVIEYQLTWEWGLREVDPHLVLHRVGEPVTAWLAQVAPEAEHVDLFIDAEPELAPPDDMLAALSRFADEMSATARPWLRVRYPEGMGEQALWAIRMAVPAPQMAWRGGAVRGGRTSTAWPARVAAPASWSPVQPLMAS
ncbi:hypothetical protein KIH74_35280 [Kineosporia sp. J2-2]|uniref:Uncharacterized protein n=1 Tax=Kineosporia corallincola TaxID=2835133 RepID=A0ABS5TU07_9ACTN|nr:hypothetical protein [Kineosporia corallincola]MBT0774260.1 hypothetical protein [Kineosporia corallincola]